MLYAGLPLPLGAGPGVYQSESGTLALAPPRPSRPPLRSPAAPPPSRRGPEDRRCLGPGSGSGSRGCAEEVSHARARRRARPGRGGDDAMFGNRCLRAHARGPCRGRWEVRGVGCRGRSAGPGPNGRNGRPSRTCPPARGPFPAPVPRSDALPSLLTRTSPPVPP